MRLLLGCDIHEAADGPRSAIEGDERDRHQDVEDHTILSTDLALAIESDTGVVARSQQAADRVVPEFSIDPDVEFPVGEADDIFPRKSEECEEPGIGIGDLASEQRRDGRGDGTGMEER